MADLAEALYEQPPATPPKPSRIAEALHGGSQWLIDNIGQFVPPELRGKVESVGQMLNMVNPATAYQNYNEAARQGNYGEAALNTLGLIPGEALATGAAKIAAAGALGAKLRPYEGVPDSLMGFRRAGQNTAFEDQAWSHIQPVRVRLPNGDVFEDAVKGLNQSHALERARRNWEPGSVIEAIK